MSKKHPYPGMVPKFFGPQAWAIADESQYVGLSPADKEWLSSFNYLFHKPRDGKNGSVGDRKVGNRRNYLQRNDLLNLQTISLWDLDKK